MKFAVQRLAEGFRAYAVDQGWQTNDYRILVEINHDWGRIHVIFVANQFPGNHPEENWLSVIRFLETDLKEEPELLGMMNLTLRTFDQVKQGGLYSLSPAYEDVDELIAPQAIG